MWEIKWGCVQKRVKCYLSFRGSLESSVVEKQGGNKKKKFPHSKMWKNDVWGGACENPMRLYMYQSHMKPVEYIWVFTSGCLIGFCHETAEMHSLCL